MGLEHLEGVRKGLQGPPVASWAYLVMALGILLILALLVHILVSRLQRRRRRLGSWEAILRGALILGLSPRETEILKHLARRAAPDEPLEVMERIDVFETAVHGYFESLSSFGAAQPRIQDGSDHIGAIRAKLNFLAPSGAAYYSTRELAPGQQVCLTLRDGKETVLARARAGPRREDLLQLIELKPAKATFRGRNAEAVFFHGTRAFEFNAELVEVDERKSSCLASHTLEVRLAGRRDFYRGTIDGPVMFKPAAAPPDELHEGTLRDLSIGGACLICSDRHDVGTELILQIRPSQYLGDLADDGGLKSRQFSGTIIGARKADGARSCYHIEFHDTDADDEQYLFQLVNRLDLVAQENAGRGFLGGEKTSFAFGRTGAH